MSIIRDDLRAAAIGEATAKTVALRYAALAGLLLAFALTSPATGKAFPLLACAAFAWWLFLNALRGASGWQARRHDTIRKAWRWGLIDG